MEKRKYVHWETAGVIKRNVYATRVPPDNYLKFYPVVFKWARAQSGLTSYELQMLIFLYSETLFSKEDFKLFNRILPFDYLRFLKMETKGWITKWRDSGHTKKALYNVSVKGIGLVRQI